MLTWVMLILALGGAVAASYTDLKRGIIPNKLSFPLFFAGIAGNLAVAITRGDTALLLDLLKAVAITFLVGYALWLVGGMAAGDVKEFMFLAALLPRYPEVLLRHFTPALAWYPFPLSIFVNSFLVAFPFLYIYALILALRRMPLKHFLEPLYSPQEKLKTAVYLTAAYSVTPVLGGAAGIAFAAAVLLLIRRDAARLVASGAALGAAFIWGGADILQLFRHYLFISLVLILFSMFLHSLKMLRQALKREVRITALEEGTIPAEEIYIRNGEVIREEKGILDKIKDCMSSGTMKRGTRIAGTSAAGLTWEQIASLRRLVEEGKLEDRIKVKERMPFAPVILLGLITALVFGDMGRLVRS